MQARCSRGLGWDVILGIIPKNEKSNGKRMDNDMETCILEWIIGIRLPQSLVCFWGDPSNKDSSTLRSIWVTLLFMQTTRIW